MNSKHTKGPWSYNAGNRDVVVSEAGTNDVLIAQLYRGSQSEANASLIAAAPELLEAAQAGLSLLTGSGFTDNAPTVVKLKAAIAKAEGK